MDCVKLLKFWIILLIFTLTKVGSPNKTKCSDDFSESKNVAVNYQIFHYLLLVLRCLVKSIAYDKDWNKAQHLMFMQFYLVCLQGNVH